MRTFIAICLSAAASAAFLEQERMTTWGANLKSLNKGVMKAMQSDMDSTDTDCYVATDATGLAIDDAFDLLNYAGESFNPSDFSNHGQIMAIQLMDEFTRCGFNNYLIELDAVASKLPQLTGSVSNLATQIITGYSDEDTAVFLTLD